MIYSTVYILGCRPGFHMWGWRLHEDNTMQLSSPSHTVQSPSLYFFLISFLALPQSSQGASGNAAFKCWTQNISWYQFSINLVLQKSVIVRLKKPTSWHAGLTHFQVLTLERRNGKILHCTGELSCSRQECYWFWLKKNTEPFNR